MHYKGGATPQIVLSVSGSKPVPATGHQLTRLNSCQITKTNFFAPSLLQKNSDTATTIASSLKKEEPADKVSILAVDGGKEKKSSNSSLLGRWTNEEHRLFLEGIRLFKRDWRSIEKHIGTRTCSQIRSHAQKYYMRLERQ